MHISSDTICSCSPSISVQLARSPDPLPDLAYPRITMTQGTSETVFVQYQAITSKTFAVSLLLEFLVRPMSCQMQ